MKYLTGFFSFWYDFIVGDDWRLAAGVVLGLVVCGVGMAKWHLNLWWLMPLAVLISLAYSLKLATKK